MGQNASSPERQDGSHSGNIHLSRRGLRRTSDLPSPPPFDGPSVASTMGMSNARHSHSRTPSTRLLATFTRQISASSIGVGGGVSPQTETSGRRDDIFYEQQEERPLLHMEDLGMRNAPITHITASPMPRRSRLSRLSSMIIPREINRQRARGNGEHQVSWSRPLTRDSLEIARQAQRHQDERPPNQDARPPDPLVEAGHSGRRPTTQISRRIPLRPDSPMPSSILAISSHNISSRRSPTPDPAERLQPSGSPAAQFSRLSRVRRSLSTPFDIPSFAYRPPTQDIVTNTPPQRPTRESFPNLGAIPQTSFSTVPASEFSRIASNSFDHIDQRIENMDARETSDFLEADQSNGRGSSWADRWAERSHEGRRESRRVSTMLSGRSTHSLTRDQDGPLPRILNLAALALAARLAGTNTRSTHELQQIGPDVLDGNLQNLLQALQNTAHPTTGEISAEDDGEAAGHVAGPVNPLSYLRVFRFVSIAASAATNAEPSNQGQSNNPTATTDQREPRERISHDSEGRTVTLVVIGVRSVPSDDSLREASPILEPGLDPLLEIPALPSASNILSAENGNSQVPASGNRRISNSRRASVGGIGSFPADYDSQRHQRILSSQGPRSIDDTPIPEFATPPALPTSDSPPGPRPPPSTPAEPSLSAYSSQVTTPSRRPSSASFTPQAPISTREATISHLREVADSSTTYQGQPTQRVQHRRRSESEFARHRDLGAGAARRNGVVAPDEIDNPVPAIARSRSWLIYVVGTNIAEDHPALTAPSLFSDNPSYEDMLLLSSLLGPAKPPVASPEDVLSAGGLYRIGDNASPLAAASIQGESKLQLGPDERCLVCLEEYQAHEELRQLSKCLHVFHRACIDEWLTTGRNSCPLCRGQGVSNEKRDGEPQSALEV